MPQSLQCPRCDGSVTVADQSAGQRVKCPHCQQTFLAPGIANSASDDDDWLVLREPPERGAAPKLPERGAAPKPPAKTSQPPSPAGRGRKLSPEDEALLAEFASDLGEFTAELETPAARPAAVPVPVSAGMPTKAPPPQTAKSSKEVEKKSPPTAEAEPVQYANEYRVTCNICGSFLYAKASQAGKQVKCPDCHSEITIPSPPKVRKKFQVNMEEAETFSFESNPLVERRPDPYQKSADELLEEAAGGNVSVLRKYDDDAPSVMQWLKGVFSPFKDLGVLVHLVGLCVFACVPTAIALSMDSPILVMGLFPGGIFLALLSISCGLAILQAVANGEPNVSDWPTLDPIAWLGQLFLVGAAATVAAIPVWIVCMFVLGPQLLSVAITMFAIYVLFPFVLLSMLDMNSMFVPFSSEVARSVTKCEESWGGFYFSSGLLFVALFLIFSAASTMSPISGAVLAIVAAVTGTFMYFGMIGRLAQSIGKAVNDPPRHDHVDRTRHTDIA
jgi:DNA-directed RNA polymerase subunit M/transcription elongation factor TFIIS